MNSGEARVASHTVFMLLRVGGLMISTVIDAFVIIYQRKLSVTRAHLYQLYVRKIAS